MAAQTRSPIAVDYRLGVEQPRGARCAVAGWRALAGSTPPHKPAESKARSTDNSTSFAVAPTIGAPLRSGAVAAVSDGDHPWSSPEAPRHGTSGCGHPR